MRRGIQLYTLREVEEPLPELLERVADAGLDGVEFAYRVTEEDEDPAAVADALDRTGLEAAAAHVQIEDLEDDLGGTVEFYDRFDCRRLVIPALPEEAFGDVEAVESTADRLDALADRAADHGVELAYHNHTHEFVPLEDGREAFAAFVADSDLAIEFDVGLATHAGADPVAYLEDLSGRVPLIHLTDTVVGDEDRVHADLGSGDVDVDACVDAAREAGAEWLLAEHGLTDDPLGYLDHVAEFTAAYA
jgi:sugar phosphate isomerase/epimerase